MSPQFDPAASESLWAFDYALLLARPSLAEVTLRERWTRSPGRSLLEVRGDLSALVDAWSSDLPAVHRAAGVDDVPVPTEAFKDWFLDHDARWQALHATIPGECVGLWHPPDDSVLAALQTLDDGTLWAARGAALGWLARQALASTGAISPLGRNLMDELRARMPPAFTLSKLASVLTPDPGLLTLRETQLLRIAIAINAKDDHPRALFRTWAIARWLHGGLELAGVTGLVEFHSALAPLDAGPPQDLLAPSRFGIAEGEELSLREIAVVAGLTSFVGTKRLPPALTNGLAELLLPVALRPLRGAERDVERAQIAEHANGLKWPSDLPIAPPLAARQLLGQWAVPWLARATDDVFNETVERLAQHPDLHATSMLAVWREGPRIIEARRQRLADVWRKFNVRASATHACLMGAGILEALDSAEELSLVELVDKSDESWRPVLLDAVCVASVRAGRDQLFSSAMERLKDTVANSSATQLERQNSMLTLMRRWEEAPGMHKARWRPAVAEVARLPIVQQREDLWRDVRRLGLDRVQAPSPAKAS